jgi:hypothetical protein
VSREVEYKRSEVWLVGCLFGCLFGRLIGWLVGGEFTESAGVSERGHTWY